MSGKRSDYYYDLPNRLIAQDPLPERSGSRLLHLNKKTGAVIHHACFFNVLDYLSPGDCIVFNDTRVINARLYGQKEDNEKKIELLLHKRIDDTRWEILCKPGRKCKPGDSLLLCDGKLTVQIEKIIEGGLRVAKLAHDVPLDELLAVYGETPLPHYIKKPIGNPERYQTVYAKYDGSVAAPTAGLHFTDELIFRLKQNGVEIVFLTLHVGLGTFRPVKTENIADHHMHSEYCRINKDEAEKINRAKKNGCRIVAVGTTCCRTLESRACFDGFVQPGEGWTDIFIYPGYRFKCADGLITNFHLPESTLIMLVSAFAGREYVLNAYREAVENEYRFFSFGDAMLIT
ncbi:MAG: tRNA preQ1(34) S-adenosylmethionine ribosyltransferase-isomerase QueA [Defluviitaleaceae bacterium]|nr:tRNA preQ1(34) S-adenosylmethionine ribosyltransferase-isomerase QueA [Defluviitaleaceae bacterium]